MASRWFKPIVASLVFAFAATSAQAQNKDTVRVAVYQPVPLIDPIYNPSPETVLITNIVYDSLIYFDAGTREFKPSIAKSWQRISDKVYEFKLREGVKFHDGSTLDADDVVYSLEVFIDPKHNFRFKDTRFGWIDKVEKVDQFTVRITSKEVVASLLSRLGYTTPIFPKKIYSALENKGDFGRNPVGTGPYKVVSFNPAKGEVVYEQFADYSLKDVRPPGTIKRILLSSIPDKQTQMAKLLAGELDVVYEVPPDSLPSLRANPNLAVSVDRTVSFSFIQFDAKDRSGFGLFKDKRIREAMLKAIDRPALNKAFLPQELWNDPLQPAMCHEWHIACAASAQPVSYDPEGAKKLLAEAGHPNGFELLITTWGPARPIAEAVSGQLRRIGVIAKVEALTVGVWAQKRADGKLQAAVSFWDNGGGAPDVEGTLGFFFIESSRDYIGDPLLVKAETEGRSELDPKKREDIYRAAFDRVTNERYMMPLVPIPATLAHNKDLQLLPGHKSPEGMELNFLAWKK